MSETLPIPDGRNEGAKHPPAWRGWAILAVMLLGYVIWTTVIYLLVGERDRHWLYGTKPSVPSASVYSTEAPRGGLAPRQVAPIPAPVPAKANARGVEGAE